MFARPNCTRFGSASARDFAMWPSVFRPVSPYSAASGSSPIPTLSRTIQMIRSNGDMTQEVYNVTFGEQLHANRPTGITTNFCHTHASHFTILAPPEVV